MIPAELIDFIRGQLDGRPTSVAAEVLALEYARQCRDVNERLGKIGLMLEGGGEIQALQFAEQPPRLVDTALALSFGGESAWQDFCRNHGHEVTPFIDARTLEALLAMQGKGLASNHPLYRDYRAAVSSRDDERAHGLIRIIAKMNPGDENAAKELKRLQRKALQGALTQLRANLEAGDELLLTAMDQVETAGMAEDYEQSAEWKQAVVVRNRVRRTAGRLRMPEALCQAEENLKLGEWRQAAVQHGEYVILASTYGLGTEQADLEERARKIELKLEQHRAEAERVAKCRHLVMEMEGIADEVETRMVTPLGLTNDFAGPLVEELTRKLRQLESLRGDFPNSSRMRIESARAQLTQALDRAGRSKRLRLVGGLAAAAVFLIAATGIGVLFFRASGEADSLVSLRGKQSSSGVRDLVNRIQNDEPVLLKLPRLATEVAQSNRWLESVDANRLLVERELEALEHARSDEFAKLVSSDLFDRLEETGALIGNLPPDLGTETSARLTVLRNDGERVMLKRQGENDSAARTTFSKWSRILETITFDGPAAEAGLLLEPAQEELAPFLKLGTLKHPLLQLPASTAALIADLGSRVGAMQDRTEASIRAVAALSTAETSASYLEALTHLASCSFSETSAAQRIVDTWPDNDRLKAFLVFKGDLAALKAAANDVVVGMPVPEAADAKDREVISALASSEILNGLWEVEWKNRKGENRKCLSQGALERDVTDGLKGKVANYPKLTSEVLKFSATAIASGDGNVILSNQPTATAAMMSKLGLKGMLDDTGTKFRSSVLPLMDIVANDQKAKPLAKAYVWGQLLRLVRNHKREEWGLHYCPGMVDDIKRFEEVAMMAPLLESAWLLEKTPEYAAKWEQFFSSLGKRSTFIELRQTHAAATAISSASVDLAGYVTIDGTIVLSPSPVRRLLLAVCEVGDGVHELKVCGIADARASEFISTQVISPLSPLLALNLPEESQNFLLTVHQNGSDKKSNLKQP
jgi:hypothetical protein